MPKRVLFLAHHRPDRSPGQRFRFEQYLTHLEAHGFECHLSPLIRTECDDHILYGEGHYMGKSLVFLDSLRTRAGDWRQHDRYDIVFIYREALMTRRTVFERLFRRSRARLIFGFDDAIWREKLSMLVEQPALRTTLGPKGRETVMARYSVASQRDNYVQYFNEVLDRPRARGD